ncbi:MAG: hypothetical protein GF372_00455 [Candidatus Marinimicrobia bacterium]|nr:hypothetical protein [Candidatus Neomarinimicrobiota bacterium]
MADILDAASNTLAAGRKYQEVLSIFGLNADFFSRFETIINETKAVTTERENRVLLSNTTDSKDDILAECYQWGKYLNLRLRNAFGHGSREHQKFPSDTFYAASQSERTEWRWDITATENGTHQLHLTLSALIPVDGQPTHRTIRTFDHVITVHVSLGERIAVFLSDNWQWIMSALLIPLITWVVRTWWKRRTNS